ncbi:MAG: hypothetical protein K0041_08755 [Acidithiobacillus sp.]|nr:hypothetical protein [Acidithiobacillus sp.]
MPVQTVGVNKSGNSIVIADTSSRGGGDFVRPRRVIVAELQPGTEYTKSNAKNVIKSVEIGEYNDSSTKGPNSKYARLMEKAQKVAKDAAKQKHLGAGVEL